MADSADAPPHVSPRGASVLRAVLGAVSVAAVIAVFFCVPAVREIVRSWSIESIRDQLLRMGAWAWAFSALLMILQAIVSPLPAFVITIANGYVFGWLQGGVLSLLSATLAAQVCFEIARALGRPPLERWAGKRLISWADDFFARHGVWAILVARLLPFLPFDPISYAAGLTATARTRFIAANLIGQLPATFVYSTLGTRLEEGKLPPEAIFFLCTIAVVITTIAVIRGTRRPSRAALP